MRVRVRVRVREARGAVGKPSEQRVALLGALVNTLLRRGPAQG